MSNTTKTITAGADISRSPREVFDYISDATQLPEWQPDVRRAELDVPTQRVGARGHEVRHVMGADRKITWEITEYEPGHRYGVHGLDGPVRAHVSIELTPTADATGTHLEYAIGFEGHGIGKLIAILARARTTTALPANLERLKHRLEEDRQERP